MQSILKPFNKANCSVRLNFKWSELTLIELTPTNVLILLLQDVLSASMHLIHKLLLVQIVNFNVIDCCIRIFSKKIHQML